MSLLNVVVDLSHHNNVNSFQAAKDSGILGIIHKATQGTNFVDPNYDERRPQALSVGLFWGAYHFGIGGDVEGQVNHFLDTVNPDPKTLLVLDFEPNTQGPTMTLAEAESFVQEVNERTGRFPGLYSGQAFINEQLGNNSNTVLKNCFLWIARFSSQLPKVPPAFQTFTLFQYTDGAAGPQPHQVPGIGRCDRNKFNGDEAGLRGLWGQDQ
ncbi:MAG TPA: glycoside hydrolase family 25 protein [Pyrinomonadaceae bacterium]|nr:glycoside hydrolase family 25 protein [Pyrinomonadaceae bacterium]